MKKGWEAKRLGDVLLDTETAAPQRQPDLPFEYIDVSSVSNTTFEVTEAQSLVGREAPSRARRRVRANDVLFATIRPTLKRIAIVPPALDSAICSTGFIVLRGNAELLPRLLFYYLQTDAFIASMERLQKGASYPAVTDNDVRNQLVPVPPISEQRRIVAILDEAFEGVAAAKANAEANCCNSTSVFRSCADESFQEVARHSPLVELGKACDFVRGPFGGSLKKSMFVSEGFAVYEQQHAINDQFSDIRYFVDAAKFDSMKRFQIRAYDLIMSCSGTMGRVAIAPPDVRPGIINQALLKLTPSKDLDGRFLRYWMDSSAFQAALKERSGGVAMQNVASVKTLKEIAMPLPDLHSQRRVVARIESAQGLAADLGRCHQDTATALDELKASLLHQAFTGAL